MTFSRPTVTQDVTGDQPCSPIDMLFRTQAASGTPGGRLLSDSKHAAAGAQAAPAPGRAGRGLRTDRQAHARVSITEGRAATTQSTCELPTLRAQMQIGLLPWA